MVTDKNIFGGFYGALVGGENYFFVKTRNSTVTDDRENSILHIIFD